MSLAKKEINIQIGRRLHNARENCGHTQEEFAEYLNVGVEHYRKIESGAYGLHPEKMLLLYEKYRIDPTYLITGQQPQVFDLDMYLSSSTREDRNKFIKKVLLYMGNLITG